jgi:hypothetical protein
MHVELVQTPWGDNKTWVRCEMRKSRVWFPSFEDLFRIIRCISACEDARYKHGRGRDLFAEFLHDAVYSENFGALREKYGIPKRSLETEGYKHG